ncbi:hypothetical protein ACSSS7_005226 [Eimeria intestinalis]
MKIAWALSSWLAATAASSANHPFSFPFVLAAATRVEADGSYLPFNDGGDPLLVEAVVEGPPGDRLLLHAAPTVFMEENGKNAAAAAAAGSPNAATEVGKERGSPPPPLPLREGPPKKPSGGPMRLSELEELAGVVKIFVDSVKADFVSPWQVMAQTEHTGSGFAIEGQMIMTNAHLVADQTRVLVRKHGNPKRYLARVLAVCHECDLALVTVEEDSFWMGVKPLVFGEIPQLRIDAAINPGNSGGPAVSRGKVVGVAFQGFSQMQNLGFIVPYPVIRHFLNDVTTHRKHTGFVSVGIKAQTMENEEALPPNVTAEGVLVTAVDQLRLRLYKEGQIVLPISRYGPLTGKKDMHAQCAAAVKKQQQQQQAIAPCAAAEDVHTTQLLVDLPAGASGDALASQRDVREGETRVVWEPEGWAASGQGEKSSLGGPTQPFVSIIKLHSPGVAPTPAVPLSHLEEKQPGTNFPRSAPSSSLIDSEGKPRDADEAAAAGITVRGSPDDQQTAARGTTQIAETASTGKQGKGGGAESSEDGGPVHTQAEEGQQQHSTERMHQRSSSGKSAKIPEGGETSDLNGRGSNENNNDKQAYLRSLLLMLLKKSVANEKKSQKEKEAMAEVPGDEEEESEKDVDKEEQKNSANQQLAPSQEKRVGGIDERNGPDEREKVRGLPRRPQIEANPIGPMHAAPTSAEESRIKLEVEVIKVEAASRRTEAPGEEQQQLERGGRAVDHLKGGNNEKAEAAEINALEPVSAHTDADHAALAPAAFILAPNPYFDPEVTKDEQFFGLREGDVLLSIGNYNIADDGTVSFRDLERVAFTYVVTPFFNGQTTFAYVLREGRIVKVTVPLMAPNLKVPPFSWDTKPSYFVFGGFVFTPLTKVLLQAKLHKEAPFMFEHLVARLDFQEKEGDQFVVLSLILASDVSVGYEEPPCVVESVNGEEVRNMRDLVRLIENTSGEFVKLRLALGGSNHMHVVIDKQKAQAIQQNVLREHNIVHDRSPDLM